MTRTKGLREGLREIRDAAIYLSALALGVVCLTAQARLLYELVLWTWGQV